MHFLVTGTSEACALDFIPKEDLNVSTVPFSVSAKNFVPGIALILEEEALLDSCPVISLHISFIH